MKIIENIQDITITISALLNFLTYNFKIQEQECYEKYNENPHAVSDTDYYFKSQIGVSVISKTVTQINAIRYTVCRNLLILQQIILSHPESFSLQSLSVIKSSIAPKTVVFCQAYYAILWVCKCNTVNTLSQTYW